MLHLMAVRAADLVEVSVYYCAALLHGACRQKHSSKHRNNATLLDQAWYKGLVRRNAAVASGTEDESMLTKL
jgi:hypothetical protein